MKDIFRKEARRARRKSRVRGKISGTAERPRLSVAKSLKNTYAQLIDDEKMMTLAMVSTLSKEMAGNLANKNKMERAAAVGEEVARVALTKGIKKVTFDRNGILYHGRIKALAEAARKAGLEF
jgi:large subunit ribosomal protein L18